MVEYLKGEWYLMTCPTMRMNLQTVALVVLLSAPVSSAFQNNDLSPLPPMETVLKRVVERALKEDDERAFKQRYRYVRNTVTEQRNAEGELQKRREKTKTNSPASSPIVSRPRASSARPKRANSWEKSKEPIFDRRSKAFERDDFALDDNLLSRFEFTLVGRETVHGRPTLIVDFRPARNQPRARNIKDRFINKAAGRAWVDEEEYALVKANVRLTDRVNVIGGLVGAVWKFEFDFDRERTEDGFWYARSMNWHLEGREVFLHRTIDFHEKKSSVEKVW